MLLDGASLLDGSTLEISPVDEGASFPASPVEGKRFKKTGTGAGNYVYSAFLTTWIPVTNVAFNSYDISSSIFDRPRSSDVVVRHLAARTFYLKPGLEGCSAKANVAATASTVFVINAVRGGVTTQIGTLTFAAGGTVGTYASLAGANAVIFGVGDELTIVAPATRDTTLSTIAITMAGLLFV